MTDIDYFNRQSDKLLSPYGNYEERLWGELSNLEPEMIIYNFDAPIDVKYNDCHNNVIKFVNYARSNWPFKVKRALGWIPGFWKCDGDPIICGYAIHSVVEFPAGYVDITPNKLFNITGYSLFIPDNRLKPNGKKFEMDDVTVSDVRSPEFYSYLRKMPKPDVVDMLIK